ncbi:MAG: EAL domain-containing protein [Actinomycetales bacterium]|nr:EAL domain-containing protein [Actinomycetales bacterium]
MTSPPEDTAALDAELDRVLTARDLGVVFQPLVSLRTDEVVGLEALARGPAGSALEHPRELFAAARRLGRVGELDWACRATAFEAFAAADLPPSMSLFVNIEPEALATPCPPDLVEQIARAESLLRVFVEVNDRALATDPAGLIRTVDRARASGWGVALDDVGSGEASLAVLPLVGADLVKLDLRLLQECEPQEAASITLGALRLVESTHAALLVEGIETAEDLSWATALGATYGQGYRIGAPGPLAESYPMPRAAVPLRGHRTDEDEDCAPSHHLADRPTTTMSPELVDDVARMVYRAALAPGAAPVVLASRGATRQDAALDTGGYPSPQTTPLLVVLFDVDGDQPELPGVRQVSVAPHEALASETFLVVLRDAEAVAMAAWPSDERGLVDVALSQDATVVHEIARHLISRIPSSPGVYEETDAEEPEPADDAEPARSGWRHRLRRS